MSQAKIKRELEPIAGGDDEKFLLLIAGGNVKCFWKAIWIYGLKLKIYILFNPETEFL